ncbi:putative uncharacterized protein [Dorea sp. CAG:317]|nr:putative uncharacterized protein [Dorea sp. CAG:317]
MSDERTNEEVVEAKRQIDSLLYKLKETVKTLEGKENPSRYKSQITLAKRRVEALTIANELIEKEINGD